MFRKFGMNDVKIIFCTLVFIPKLSFQMPEINVYFLPDDMTFLDLSQVWLLLLHFSTALGILSQNIFFWLISLLNREHFGVFFSITLLECSLHYYLEVHYHICMLLNLKKYI